MHNCISSILLKLNRKNSIITLMTNHEHVIMAMTTEMSESPSLAQEGPIDSTHLESDHHHHEHEHIHEHSHSHDHEHESNSPTEKVTRRHRFNRWLISKSGIMQNPHVEQITAATCCGAVCRGDLPMVAAYIGTTAVAALRTPKHKDSETVD